MRMPHFSPTAIASARATSRLLTRTSSGAPVGLSSVMIEPGPSRAASSRQVQPDPAELDGDLERHVVEQGLERLRVEAGVVDRFTHDLVP